MLKSATVALSFLLLFVLAACADQDQGRIRETAVAPTVSPQPSPPIKTPVTIQPLPTTRPRRLNAGELQLAADIDDIPAIFAEDALFVDVETGSQEWAAEELVIGIIINDDARAYPIRLLSNHEIVNDNIGGEPVMITWCPLCFTAIVFDRVIDNQTLTFGVSGYLYYNNLVMYDHRTNTLWSQVAGQGIRGAFRGEQLAVRPSLMTSWGEWRAAYPDTDILSAVALETSADTLFDPYSGYYRTASAGITGWSNPNDLLPPKELVVGLVIGQEARAYPLTLLRQNRLVQDDLAGIPIVLVYEPTLGSVIAFRRETAEGALTFALSENEEQLQDQETGTIWDIKSGRAVEGELAGNDLSRLAAPLIYWFAWSDIQTATDIYPNPLTN